MVSREIGITTFEWQYGRYDRFNVPLPRGRVLVVPGSSGPKYDATLEKVYQERLVALEEKNQKPPLNKTIVRADSLTYLTKGDLIIACGPVPYWKYVSNTNNLVRRVAGLTKDAPLEQFRSAPDDGVVWQKTVNQYAPHQFGVATGLKIRGDDSGERLMVLTKKNVYTPWPNTMELQSLAGHSDFAKDLGENRFWHPFVSALNQIGDESGIRIGEIDEISLAGFHTDPETAGTSYVNGIFICSSLIKFGALLHRKGDGENRLAAIPHDFSLLTEIILKTVFSSQPYMTGLLLEVIAHGWGQVEVDELLPKLRDTITDYQQLSPQEKEVATKNALDYTSALINAHLVMRSRG